MNIKTKNHLDDEEIELNKLKAELKIRGVGTRFFAEFYCLKKGRRDQETLNIIQQVHSILTKEYIEETKQILSNKNNKFIEKIKWYVGRLFKKEFDNLMYLLRDYDQTNGSYILEHCDEIQMDKVSVLRCKEIFGITENDEEVKELKNKIDRLDDELKKKETMIYQLQWKLDESTKRESNLKKENETIQNEIQNNIKNNKNVEEELIQLKKEYQNKMNEINELKEMRDKFEELKKQNEELQNENKSFKENVHQMNRKVKEYEQNEMKLKQQITKQEEETNKYKTKTKRYYVYSKQKEDEIKQLKNQLTGKGNEKVCEKTIEKLKESSITKSNEKIIEKSNETKEEQTQTDNMKNTKKSKGKLKEVIKRYESMTLDKEQIQQIQQTNSRRKLQRTQSVCSPSENSIEEWNHTVSDSPFISSHTSNPALKRSESLKRIGINKPENQYEKKDKRITSPSTTQQKENIEKIQQIEKKEKPNRSSVGKEQQIENDESKSNENIQLTQPMIKISHQNQHNQNQQEMKVMKKEKEQSKFKEIKPLELKQMKEENKEEKDNHNNDNEMKPVNTIDDFYQSNLSQTIRSRREMFEQMTNSQNPNSTQTPRLTIKKSSNPNLRAWKLFDK